MSYRLAWRHMLELVLWPFHWIPPASWAHIWNCRLLKKGASRRAYLIANSFISIESLMKRTFSNQDWKLNQVSIFHSLSHLIGEERERKQLLGGKSPPYAYDILFYREEKKKRFKRKIKWVAISRSREGSIPPQLFATWSIWIREKMKGSRR